MYLSLKKFQCLVHFKSSYSPFDSISFRYEFWKWKKSTFGLLFEVEYKLLLQISKRERLRGKEWRWDEDIQFKLRYYLRREKCGDYTFISTDKQGLGLGLPEMKQEA